MSRRKIVIIGGGSNAWTPNVVKDMLLTESLSDCEYILYDINKKASDLTKMFLDKLARELGVKPKIISTDNRAKAFQSADYFIITISTGGLNAMSHDLAIPQEFGIYHTVGDTSGPGGWARMIRNFKVIDDLGRAITRYAPGAVVLNYTNPMATLTDVLCRLHDGPVVGLCHGLFENLSYFTSLYKLKSEEDISVSYAGINHFFWITSAQIGKRDVIGNLKRRLKTKSFTDLLDKAIIDEMGFASGRAVATELFRQVGAIPYIGDRHTCEFFPWYITSRKVMKHYDIVRTTIAQRRQQFRKRDQDLRRMIKGKIPKKFRMRSRETAANIIDAHSNAKVFIDVGNLPNTGQITNLPKGLVVETAVRVDGNGFTPIHFGQLPEAAAAMIRPWATVFTMVVDACFNRDKHLALLALRLDPLCSHLSTQQVNLMGNRLLKAHRRYVQF